MGFLRRSPARSSRRLIAWLTLAWLASAGATAAQPPVAIPPPRSWTMLDLARGLPALPGRRGAGTPCDTGATIAPDRIRVTGDGVACLPNPAHDTRMWCGVLDPVTARPDAPATSRKPTDRFTQTSPNWANSIHTRSGYSDYFLPLPPRDDCPDNWDSTFTGPGPGLLESSRRILRALEWTEAWQTAADPAVRSRLDVVDTLLRQEVRAHGPGREAWLLTARLRRLRRAGTWMPDTPTASGDASLASALAAAEEAVRAAPDDAATHAWQAVVFDTRLPRRTGDVWEAAPLDRARALASLRRACELAPTHAGYATLQARWLAEADDFPGAREALRSCPRADRTLVRILDDLCRLPRFRDLGFHPFDDYALTDWRGRLEETLRRFGRDVDFPEFRLRGWSWPGSASAAEEALRRVCPGFRWFPVRGAVGGWAGALYAQRVASPETGAAPATKPPVVSQDLESGVSLILLEQPAPAGERPCCTLIVVDWRVPD
jgi:hypothetical protein